MNGEFQVMGTSPDALFTLKLHRGDGMTLLAMNWKNGKPPRDFVGFAIEYKEPEGDRFFVLKNRIAFADRDGKVNTNILSSRLSPIQKFRWVHFPRNADLRGEFVYKVTPVFMNNAEELSYGVAQQAAIELRRETYPGQINIAFTRGFLTSQAYIERFASAGPLSDLLPGKADTGLEFKPKHLKAEEALAWLGFEARLEIISVLDQAIKDATAEVRVIAYDLNEPGIVDRLELLEKRLKIIIDDSGSHKAASSAETKAEHRLASSAGAENVKRQHMQSLQHNKVIVVKGENVQAVVCGSTNFSWRGFFVQNNHAVILRGNNTVTLFLTAFDKYWERPKGFETSPSATWNELEYEGIDAKLTFSPHGNSNAQLSAIADDIENNTTSSLFYSLAFLYETPGPILESIKKVTNKDALFVYGISDKEVDGIDIQKPNGNIAPVYPTTLTKNVPEPFSEEPSGGLGTRMHHKFVVIDFDKPSGRVYLGSYNFSSPADTKNGENLLIIRDRRIAVSFMIEALRIFDHYHFRLTQQNADEAKKELVLAKAPSRPEQKPWWDEYYTDIQKIRDRELFA